MELTVGVLTVGILTDGLETVSVMLLSDEKVLQSKPVSARNQAQSAAGGPASTRAWIFPARVCRSTGQFCWILRMMTAPISREQTSQARACASGPPSQWL